MVAPFIGPFMAPGPAARADVQAAKPQLVAHFLGVIVFDPADGMAAPANHQIRPHLQLQNTRVAQDVKYRVGDAGRGGEVEAPAFHDLIRNEHHIAQHGEQVVLQSSDHHAVDEGRGRGVLDLQLDAPGLAHDAQIEVPVFLENHPRIVDVAARIEHGERALAEQRIQAALPRIEQFGDFRVATGAPGCPSAQPAHRPCRRIESWFPLITLRGARPAPMDRYRSECCLACASTLRPYLNWTKRCSRRSSRSTRSTQPGASACSESRES